MHIDINVTCLYPITFFIHTKKKNVEYPGLKAKCHVWWELEVEKLQVKSWLSLLLGGTVFPLGILQEAFQTHLLLLYLQELVSCCCCLLTDWLLTRNLFCCDVAFIMPVVFRSCKNLHQALHAVSIKNLNWMRAKILLLINF